MKNLLIFDFNNLLYKSLAVMPPLTYNDKNVGGLYGFIQQICNKISMFNPEYVIVCNDKPPYLRKKEYSDYKKSRKPKDEEAYKLANETRDYCLEFLQSLKIPIFQKEGYEADDMIAKACEDLHSHVDKIIVVSNDDDLFQIFQYAHNIFIQKNKVFYSVDNFLTDYPDLTPEMWPLFIALKGGHNGVPGLKGVGPKSALKILKSKNEFNRILDEYGDIIDLYTKLATLPYDDTLSSALLFKAKYDNSVIRFFASYGIELTDSMHKAFMQIGG